MKLEKLVGDRFKERPSDCVVDSHALMVRGGYMKYVANGVFSQYPPLKRVTKKIENIILVHLQTNYSSSLTKMATR
jgi:prolyl-tRNA synthetase